MWEITPRRPRSSRMGLGLTPCLARRTRLISRYSLYTLPLPILLFSPRFMDSPCITSLLDIMLHHAEKLRNNSSYNTGDKLIVRWIATKTERYINDGEEK